MNPKEKNCKNEKYKTLSASIHHTYQLKNQSQEKTKVYFARLRGYRDRH